MTFKFIEIVSEQEFACEFYGYEKYWKNKEVPREEMLVEYDKWKHSGIELQKYLISIGVKQPKKRFRKHKKSDKK